MKISGMKHKAFSLIEISVVILIISVLTAGIMQSRKLSAKARLANARGLTVNSPVATMGDLVLWYETTSEKSFNSTETFDGSVVTTWYDLNPDIETVRKNATATNQPLYKNNIINGLPAIKFNSSNSDYFSFDCSSISNSNYTIFITEQRRSSQSNNYFLGNNLDLNIESGSFFLGYKQDTVVNYSGYVTGSIINTYIYGTNITRIHSFDFNFSTKKYYLNGTSQSISAPYNPYIRQAEDPISTCSILTLGKQLTNYYEGFIGEIIIFRKYLGTSERKDVENYLGKKWGVVVS
jgi:prepilin-type N-terminal cleavage/methylation domain-containing protein